MSYLGTGTISNFTEIQPLRKQKTTLTQKAFRVIEFLGHALALFAV